MAATHITLPCRICSKSVLPSTAAKTTGLCLDCFYEEEHRVRREARDSKPGCPACDGSTTSSAFWFEWGKASRGEGEFRKYPRYLRHERDVKHGARYVCTVCNALLYRHKNWRRERMMLVPPADLAVFEAWCAKQLVCPTPILKIASKIGATPPDDYSSREEDVSIPCRVVTHAGERIDFAFLRFSKEPPIPWGSTSPAMTPGFRLVDDLVRIEPSRFTCPPRVRFQTSRALEQRMDFAPTGVKTSSGRYFTLNGRTDFFDCDGVAGSELRLPIFRTAGGKLVSGLSRPVTFFMADWFDEAVDLRIRMFQPSDLLWWRVHQQLHGRR